MESVTGSTELEITGSTMTSTATWGAPEKSYDKDNTTYAHSDDSDSDNPQYLYLTFNETYIISSVDMTFYR